MCAIQVEAWTAYQVGVGKVKTLLEDNAALDMSKPIESPGETRLDQLKAALCIANAGPLNLFERTSQRVARRSGSGKSKF
jgi:hypothetical protein